MREIKVNGLKNISGMRFHDIEGGFGEGKKAMLVKEIANIHGRELKFINLNINRNIKRFTNGIDIVDLKGSEFEVTLSNRGIYTQNSLNASSNIYLLSERGYAKLLKILEDDVAWEQYEKLVDGYFNMRVKKQLSAMEILELQFKALKEQKEELDNVKNEVKELKEEMPLFNIDCKEIQAAVRRKGTECLGGYRSIAYNNNSLRGKVYSDIQHQLRREFGVNKYEAIRRSQYDKALEIINKYTVPTVINDEIITLNNQIKFDKY